MTGPDATAPEGTGRPYPVAVVGLACRLPGAADPGAFWRLLSAGTSALGEVPPDRWSGPVDGGTVRQGGFLDDISGFDADFFGISPREAAAMDPQQRLVLELAWEAIEDAGTTPAALAGTPAGVFVGAIWDDYAHLTYRGGTELITPHTVTGLHRSILANRISYLFDLHGPSLAVDTGQSSSLVAVHLACESLRNGESTTALAGGVNLAVLAESAIGAERFGGLSPDGRCFTFDARANGYARGEGAALVLLKPLADAVDAGDRIYCVIDGSAVSNDGATDGLTVPGRQGQEQVLATAYRRAGVDPAEVQYVELHGTGTRVGDPVEAAALGAVLGRRCGAAGPLLVGSAKTNIGHLEAAAGVVGLVKLALCVRHRKLPPSLNFASPNPDIPLEDLGLRVHRELTDWPSPDRPLRGGVSSFGMGGTNCHVVVRDAPARDTVEAAGDDGSSWVLSARTEPALHAYARRLGSWLTGQDDVVPTTVGAALARRTRFPHRAVVTAAGRDEFAAALDALAGGRPHPLAVTGVAADARGTAFCFTGQGSQYAGMGADLYAGDPVYREAFDQACEALNPHLEHRLQDVVFAEPGTDLAALLDTTAYTQPALFALHVALHRVATRTWGLRADHLTGHSLGEISAAHLAGVLTLTDAALLVATRARLMNSVTTPGAMIALQATRDEAETLVVGQAGVTIAAINTPHTAVISGDHDTCHTLAARWREQGRKATALQVSHAFHSPHMAAITDEFRTVAANLTYQAPTLPVVSNVTGQLATTEQLTDPDYWVEHVLAPVHYADGITTLHDQHGVQTFVELGPDGTLTTLHVQTLPGTVTATHVLHPDQPADRTWRTAVATVHTVDAGHVWPVDTARYDPPHLPGYPFQRRHHWLGTPAGAPRPPVPVPGTTGGSDTPAQAVVDIPPLGDRVRALDEPGRRRLVRDTVLDRLAFTLGHTTSGGIDPTRTFKELGFDSLMAVRFRNDLAAATGFDLPAGVTFDHPTPDRLVDFVHRLAVGGPGPESALAPAVPLDEPVVIVGMACRYPGGVATPEQLWELLAEGRDAIGPLPTDRGWDLAGLYDPDPNTPGATYAREGGFLTDASGFDAEFFGISPREAMAMDPQQRLLLETAWESVERAGIDPTGLRGERIGVFVGAMPQDYGPRMHEASGDVGGYVLTGNTPSVASGRIAYVLGLAGPAVTVDTACSSSLVAMHLAAQAIRNGECDLALAGGVTVMATPGMLVEFSRQRGLAPDGRCKPFAAAADGTGWGEGVGLLLLERLSVARERGHRILAVIRGSAVNQDGASNGLTAPNGPSQERVIRQALANARLTPADVDVVEAHGTGTTLGDPIEAEALLATYGQDRRDDQPLWLGSIKSNIGHTQAAAGVAGVIKLVLALRHHRLPHTLHLDAPTPHVNWDAGKVRLLDQPVDWQPGPRPRRAGVSSFGVSGTNAHLIIEEFPAPADPVAVPVVDVPDEVTDLPGGGWVPWLLSAKTEPALREYARRLRDWTTDTDDLDLVGVAHALANRSAFPHRAVVLGRTANEIREALTALVDGVEHDNLNVGEAHDSGKIAFIYPGQGSQWPTMAHTLYRTSTVFRHSIQATHTALREHVDWSLLDIVLQRPTAASLDRVDVVQPVLYAVTTALTALWRHHGINPHAVIGHSQGEITAAHTTGTLTLDHAVRLITHRAKALTTIEGTGGMLAITGPTPEELPDLLARLVPEHTAELHLAAHNAPTTCVLSGTTTAIHAAHTALTNHGLTARIIPVSYASHCPHVDPLESELRAVTTNPLPSDIAFYSSTRQRTVQGTELTTDYWWQNLRQPVHFHPTLKQLAADGHHTLIEISPHPLLAATIDTESTTVCHTLRRDTDPWHTLLTNTAHLHTHTTHPITWTHLLPAARAHATPPTYPFHHRSYWLTAPPVADTQHLGLRPSGHALLGAALTSAGNGEDLHTARLSTRTHSWLVDHTVGTGCLLPATAFVDIALHTGAASGHHHLDELTLHSPLGLGEQPTDLQVAIGAQDERGRRQLTVHSRLSDAPAEVTWTHHATAVLDNGTGEPEPVPPATWPPSGATPVDLDDLYTRLASSGYHYGPMFQGVRRAWRSGEDLYAEVALPEAGDTDGYGIHPALLDAALHLAVDAIVAREPGRLWLPFSWSGVRRLGGTRATTARVSLGWRGRHEVGLTVHDHAGQTILSVDSLAFQSVTAAQLDASRQTYDGRLWRLDWVPVALPAVPATMQGWVTVGGPVPGWDLPCYPDLGAVQHAVADGEIAAPAQVVVPLPDHIADDDVDVPAAVHQTTEQLLHTLQAFLTQPALTGARLTVLTTGAISTRADDQLTNLPAATCWGLVRTAQTEHPDRITLLDTDHTDESAAALPAAVASPQPQLALRGGTPHTAHLVPDTTSPTAQPFDPNGTTLITGGTGTLAQHTANHLIAHHNVKQLHLISRQGPHHPDTPHLIHHLTSLGATITITTCDTTNRNQLHNVINHIDHTNHPLTAVIHTAGTLHDATLTNLTPHQLHTTLNPKTDATWHLHTLTHHHPLTHFLLYSSIAATLGTPGQANYAAANTFQNALAQHRHQHQQPATSLNWGYWTHTSTLTAHLHTTDLQRLHNTGITPLTTPHALTLLNTALTTTNPTPITAHLNPTNLPTHLTQPTKTTASTGRWREQVAGLPKPAREEAVRELVRNAVATVLALPAASAVPLDRAFKELGFDSLVSVELRNRLSTATGLRLPATLVFDHPTPTAVVGQLLARLSAVPEGVERTAVAPTPATPLDDPVVIVGMACRYPGGVSSPEQLWELVVNDGDAIGGFPEDRGWDLAGLYDPDPERTGTTYTRHGGFLYEAARFDAEFFGISPREATAMDPQQRLLLETAWECVERAGVDPTSLRGTSTGVFTGVMYDDYGGRIQRAPEGFEGHLLTGSISSVASGRIAYTLGLEGPAVTVDTACSSSLVAMHLAAQAIRNGECDLALAGGVTVMATPTVLVEFSRQRGLAPDGRCKPFAAAADGTGWGEGVGLLLLERQSAARERGHQVLAVLRGSAVNQDGASNGLTAPNGPSQERVIRQALANARLNPADVDAVEAHGTGTTLGDPIEAQALLATYGQDRRDDQPLWLGSIKSNIGHTQAAAGAAGIIKMVLALQHDLLPRSLHIDAPTPHVDWDAGNVRLLDKAVEWKPNGLPRRAAISSFGISGTNAHVILEEAAADSPPPTSPVADLVPLADVAPVLKTAAVQAGNPADEAVPGATSSNAATTIPVSDGAGLTDLPGGGWVPWLLSAKTEPALREYARRLRDWTTNTDDLDLVGVAHALAGRTSFPHRAVVLGRTANEIREALTALVDGVEHDNLNVGEAHDSGKIAFIYPGQGSQWPTMAHTLYRTSTVFRHSIQATHTALREHVDWSLLDIVLQRPTAASLDRVDVVQPLLFAISTALTALWQHHGITPQAVIGHSQGEITAAHTSGILTLDQATHLITHRAKALTTIEGTGGMLAITGPTPEELPDLLARLVPEHTAELHLAAHNAPTTCVLSGTTTAIHAAHTALTNHGLTARIIPVSYASHCPHVDPLESELRAVTTNPLPNDIAFYSSTRQRTVQGTELTTDYWWQNLRQPVHFHPTLKQLAADGHHTLIEISPHPLLAATIDAQSTTVCHTLRRDTDPWHTLLTNTAHLHTHTTHPITWTHLLPAATTPATPPTYPFERRHYWLNASPATDTHHLGLRPSPHPILPAALELAGTSDVVLTGRLGVGEQTWLAEYRLRGTVLLPPTVMLDLALHAADQVGCDQVDELTVREPMAPPQRGHVRVQVTVTAADESGRRPITIHVGTTDDSAEAEVVWSRHATGLLSSSDAPARDTRAAWPPPGWAAVDLVALRDRAAADGWELGVDRLVAGWQRDGEFAAEVRVDGADGHVLHPTLLDAALRLVTPDGTVGKGTVTLPMAWSGVRLHAAGATDLRVRLRRDGTDGCSLVVVDGTGSPVLSVARVEFRPVPVDDLPGQATARGQVWRLDWVPVALPAVPATMQGWVTVGGPVPGWDLPCYPDLGAVQHAVADGEIAAPAQVVVPLPDHIADDDVDVPAAVHQTTEQLLHTLQAFLTQPALTGARLTVLTTGAISTRADDQLTNLPAATCWGLVRTAQTEHPDRITLLDTDHTPRSLNALAAAVTSGHPQLALRTGTPHAAHLTPDTPSPRSHPGAAAEPTPRPFDPNGTTLITGGTGTLAQHTANHLIAHHNVKQLHLISRQGPHHPDTPHLIHHLTSLGATITITTCDTTNRNQLHNVINHIDHTNHPLTAVIHTAGTLHDATLTNLTPHQLHTTLNPKTDATWHLHTLTHHHPLTHFLLYSSIAATLGTPGQANYAAANTFQNALAQHRHQHQQPATSLNWGYWTHTSTLTAHLHTTDLQRLHNTGITPLTTPHALTLLNTALTTTNPTPITAHLNPTNLPTHLTQPTKTTAAATTQWAPLLRDQDGTEQQRTLTELIRGQLAKALGHADTARIGENRGFLELGLNSLTALEFRNQLSRLTGLPLPATVVFDHPTPVALAAYLRDQLTPRQPDPAELALAELDRLETAVRALNGDASDGRDALVTRLQGLLHQLTGVQPGPTLAGDILSATPEELFHLLDQDLDVELTQLDLTGEVATDGE
ncbi:type I polyketide synthase [Micromonospora narathiwatensis]|uniref:Acyl transferase domain-containing protein n=1 Tax=Micromonospora narathiwatensis TaxID=299146 RepID=A0A1A8ZHT7_9ACTN|nr:type I polyketide synthase [Micromonospora narathiwatensis]SBT43435.1 Acyl transferase domain-containing protein [Micromonospora narathiwatensis]